MTQLHSRPASSASVLRGGHVSVKHKPFASPRMVHPGVQRCVCQATQVENALAHMQFDSCFSSPIRRARSTTEIIWQGQGRDGPCIYLDSLKEAHLGWMEGMKQAEAATNHRDDFATWRERPAEFNFDGRYPLLEVFDRAAEAWKEILEAPGSNHLVVTHKSMMRAFLCTALALPPTSFRAVDIHNGGVSIFRVNKRGEAMLTNMNMTSHMHHDDIYY
ncbi:hypothetical protein WJX79_004921 [Trebouxia sp. C0005]